MTNQTQIDKAIRILVRINDIINEKRSYCFPYANLLNDFRTVEHWRAYFAAQNTNLVAIDLILQIPELEGFFRDGWGDSTFWNVDDISPEYHFYIDLITACPMLAKYGWYHDWYNSGPASDPSVSGVRAMVRRLFETKDGFNFMAELTKMVNLTTADAFKIAYLVDCLLAKMDQTEPVSNQSVQPKVYEPKKTRSGKVY